MRIFLSVISRHLLRKKLKNNGLIRLSFLIYFRLANDYIAINFTYKK